jgi:hypothetical protein
MVFMQPQGLVVPLFQRPYVWNEENQWEPLWNDIVRVADRLLKHPQTKHQPHFLGAVVLQQVQNPIGLMQTRTIIDGQQRLTTLQLLLDALHAELLSIQAAAPAARIEPLVTNADPFCSKPEDRYKVWPTNRDRAAFNAVMGAAPPVDHDALKMPGDRMVEAHRFFSDQARSWLTGDDVAPNSQLRAAAIETVVRELLQMVVIDLTADENAQEIFETLNARGAQLTAADLIKNFIFQRLSESGTNVEAAYQAHWKDFETGFWESEISVGRLRYPRSSVFLNHWLISRTGEEVVAREIFERFKRFADHDAGRDMANLLAEVHSASRVYRDFIIAASGETGPIDRVGLFVYRTGVLESEVIKPLVLCFLDPEEPTIPEKQSTKALDVVESWMVRRMLVRATTKAYNQVVAELVRLVRQNSNRQSAGDVIESHLAAQSSDSSYWPDDEELREELEGLQAYRRLRRGRLRMVLEAVEDHLRGWRADHIGLGGERVARGKLAIEHVMPRKWAANWPVKTTADEAERDRIIHTLGNLTLLTGRLNSKVSNAGWLGAGGKRHGLEAHDVFLLNRELLKTAGDYWTDESIRNRTRKIAEVILEIWPAPSGHRSGFRRARPKLRRRIRVADLINAGKLQPGTLLFPRRKKLVHMVATVLPDGQIELGDRAYSSPSEAAAVITGNATNGWWFFLVDQASKRSLRAVRADYADELSVDGDDEGEDDDDDSDDE